jgi:hypothetical protein
VSLLVQKCLLTSTKVQLLTRLCQRAWKAAAAFSDTQNFLDWGLRIKLWGFEGLFNLSLSLPMQGVYLSSSREPTYTAAVLSALSTGAECAECRNPHQSLIQVSGLPLRSAVLQAGMGWQVRASRMLTHADVC